jgi:hypothetical protein
VDRSEASARNKQTQLNLSERRETRYQGQKGQATQIDEPDDDRNQNDRGEQTGT